MKKSSSHQIFIKTTVFLITSILSSYAWGQSEVDKIMQRATCNCISKLFATSQTKPTFSECCLKSIGKDTVLIKSECKRLYGDTTAEAFYKFGGDFFKRSSVSLVYTCDAYFKIMDSIRYVQIRSVNKDSVRNSLASLNLTDSSEWNKEFLVTRGLFYFSLSDYTNAEKDLDASLAIDSNTVQAIFFKAWILEIKRDYDSAIELYTKLATLTETNDFNIFAAIARRKKGN